MVRSELLQQARRAYERGRLSKALRVSALVLPMTFISFGSCRNQAASLVIAASLAVLAAALVWRGGSAGRGVVPGFVAGTVPLVFPLIACPACRHAGIGGLVPLLACVVGGVASGAIIAHFARSVDEHRGAYVVAAGAVAALAGSLGCVIVGLGGVGAMAVGLTLIAPIGLRATRQAQN